MMLKGLLTGIMLCALGGLAVAQTQVTLEIQGVQENSGKIYVAIYDSESAYKAKTAFLNTAADATSSIITLELQLPAGQFLFSVYQDSNRNGILDTGIFGIPKEPVGLSNYDGKGIPGGYEKLKVAITERSALVRILLYKI